MLHMCQHFVLICILSLFHLAFARESNLHWCINAHIFKKWVSQTRIQNQYLFITLMYKCLYFFKMSFTTLKNWSSLSSLGVGLRSDSFSLYIFIVPAFLFYHSADCPEWISSFYWILTHRPQACSHRPKSTGDTKFCQTMFWTLSNQSIFTQDACT